MSKLIDRLNPRLLFKASTPDLSKFIGKYVRIPGVDGSVKIEKIVGNITKKTFFEINGEHLIGMLRFFAQMHGDKSITEDQFIAFEEMELDSEVLPDKKTVLEVTKSPLVN